MTKILAFHLPQFHSFPENDEWWGKGFTEWVNVKKSVPQFKGHIQPNTPLNNYYYNLLDKETRKWQAEKAKEYGIDGFCYYHYWFDGKLLMEKPLECLLKEKDIDFPFCFCWANEPWTRAWDGRTSTILMPQRYGEEKDWKLHFDYLLDFFMDSRYIKIDNKPMLVLYRTNNIENCDAMISFWEEECIKNGFSGIHVVEELNSFQDKPVCKNSRAVVEFEPLFQLRRKKTIADDIIKIQQRLKGFLLHPSKSMNFKVFNYDKIWKKILLQRVNTNKDVYYGGFVNWDNTPRKGNRGMVALGVSPQKFENYMCALLKKANDENAEYIFLNAWNEWAEGAFLEPDTINRYSYLEAVKNAKNRTK